MASHSTPTNDNSDPVVGNSDDALAADLIRQKVARLYDDEPLAAAELEEAEASSHRSKHQQFMHELGNSGKDLATIQTEWHEYYQQLPASEKHQVWHEFYASQSSLSNHPSVATPHEHAQAVAAHKQQASKPKSSAKNQRKLRDARSTKEIKSAIKDTVTAGGKLETKHHIQSLLFGLGMGMIVIVIFLFGFFNEVFIAPFIQPSRATAATPLIVSTDSVAPSPNPEVIIPKINVQIPVDYNQTTTDEAQIENALESGIVHYPTTVKPGENGNAAFFGHSSNNIFNKGKYKFAFVMLHTLVPGDTFYLTYQNKVYVYKVITKTVVEPTEVGVLNSVPGQTATATLITCDPPGTSLRRLVVVGQQITPDPSGNAAASSTTITQDTSSSGALPGNGPTLWGRFISTPGGKALTVVALLGVAAYALRRINNNRFTAKLA